MARITRQAVLKWAALVALGGASAASSAQSLVEMAELAQNYDAPWLSSRAALDAAEHKGAQAKSGLLPTVGAQAGASYTNLQVHPRIPGLKENMPQQTAGINASQPLYRPANLITYQQGQRNVELARAQLDAATQDLLVRVSQAYFDVLAAQDTLATVQAQKRAVQEQLEFAQRNFDIGAATITDTREAQARRDLVDAQEIAAANDLQVKQLALEQVVGKSPLRPQPLAQPVQLPAVQPASVAPWVEQAENDQPLVRQARIAMDMAEMETRKAETGHLPTVDLQASYGVQRNPEGTATIPIGNRIHQGQVGVTLNMPLFAGFAVQNRVKETLSLEEKARADLDNARRQSAQAARSAFFGVQSGLGQVKALEAAVASSQSALEANQLGYQVGVRINVDVLNAQSQLYQAQRDLAQARYNVLMGQLKLRQAAGQLQVQDIHNLNQLIAKP